MVKFNKTKKIVYGQAADRKSRVGASKKGGGVIRAVILGTIGRKPDFL